MLCLFFCSGKAQHSFLYELEDGFAQDIFEDDKGCLVGLTDTRIVRLTQDGRELWVHRDITLLNGFYLSDSQTYLFSAISTEVGGLGIVGFDLRGKKKWAQYYSEKPAAKFAKDIIHDSLRKQYIVAGVLDTVGQNMKSQFWIAGLDYKGNILWENSWRDEGQSRYFTRVFKNPNSKGYLLLTGDDNHPDRKELLNVDTVGKLIERNPIEPRPCDTASSFSNYIFYGITKYNDTGYIGLVNVRTMCHLEDGMYCYVYNYKGQLIKKVKHNIWTAKSIQQTKDGGFILGGSINIQKLDKDFNLKWSSNILPKEEIGFMDIKKIKQSRDGGYFGIADGYRILNNGNWQYIVYIFKTDSLGIITYNEEYSEKKRPVMLQPNPAIDKVRIVIPYYFGKVTAQFYNLQGVLLFETGCLEKDKIDISKLSSGMYIVKARIEETSEIRTMRLIVK